jgi:hypothetical protein
MRGITTIIVLALSALWLGGCAIMVPLILPGLL